MKKNYRTPPEMQSARQPQRDSIGRPSLIVFEARQPTASRPMSGRLFFTSHFAKCPYLSVTGSAAPSDHQPAGTMNTSIGSGAPLNCGFSMTGELDRSAPQTAPSMSGV